MILSTAIIYLFCLFFQAKSQKSVTNSGFRKVGIIIWQSLKGKAKAGSTICWKTQPCAEEGKDGIPKIQPRLAEVLGLAAGSIKTHQREAVKDRRADHRIETQSQRGDVGGGMVATTR